MAGGRRNANKSSNRQQPSTSTATDDHKATKKASPNSNDGLGLKSASPKHMPFPSMPPESFIAFESIMFIFTSSATFFQFLNLYRSVWWLPDSYNAQTMSFYLIDPYLVVFITTLLIRRLVFYTVRKLVFIWSPSHTWDSVENAMRLSFLGIIVSILAWCSYKITQTHSTINIFFLCYPVLVYFMCFGFSIRPFFDILDFPKEKNKESTVKILDKPFHSCSSSPHLIRQEVDLLKRDFNNRMKQVLFSSMLNSYYAGFVPCCFAQNVLHYDVFWATQHLTFTWFGCLTMFLVHCYPIKYCDTLHRAALHLGRWVKLEGRACHLPSHLWTEGTLWQQGAMVKHWREQYKAIGISNAAEPGNSSHSRFYAIFNNPSNLMCAVVGLQLSLVLLQLALLLRAPEWYQVISLGLLLFTNYHTLFKLVRDYLICWKVYKAEALIQNKSHGG